MARKKKVVTDTAVESEQVKEVVNETEVKTTPEAKPSAKPSAKPVVTKRQKTTKEAEAAPATSKEVGKEGEKVADEVVKKPVTKRKKRKVVDENAEAERDARAQLQGGKQSMTIFNAMLESIEFHENTSDPGVGICAVVEYKGFRILVPAKEMGIELDESLSHAEKSTLYKKYLTPMLASNIDFVICSIDSKSNLAVGSRRIAMAIKKKHAYQLKKKSGTYSLAEYSMNNSIPVSANVVAVAGSTVRLEIAGVECKVLAKDADWRYTSNLATLFQPGQKIKAMLKTITVNPEDKDDISITASIKEATPNRLLANIGHYQKGNICVGVVSGITDKGYYIALGNQKTGIDVYCNTVHGDIVPTIGSKVACQIQKVFPTEGFATAKITRVISYSN